MKEIRYICTKGPVRCLIVNDRSTDVARFTDIKTGTIVTLLPSGGFDANNVKIDISESSLEKYFKRYYTDEELKVLQSIRNQAAVAAMQRLIYRKNNICIVQRLPSDVAKEAVKYADALIKELNQNEL